MMRRSRAPSFAQRQAIYRSIEAENARDVMDREVERRRKAGLVPASAGSSHAAAQLNSTPPTLEEMVAATVRALKGAA
jgi:hypothetical protein